MKLLYPFFAFLFISYLSFAQYENLDLSKYKLPDIKRHQLDFQFGLDGLNSERYGEIDWGEESDTLQSNQNNFDGAANIYYNYYRNSPKIQSYLNANTYFDYNSVNNYGDNISDYKYSKVSGSVSGIYYLNYFLSEKNWMITVRPGSSIIYYDKNYKTGETTHDYFVTSESFEMGFGKGRIEQVQDYRQAILLLNEFEKRGVARKTLSEDEVIGFGALISQTKNKRFFDSRKKREEELTAIDSFLVKNGIIETSNISYFTGLDDLWSYGALQTRESGNQFLASVSPGFSYSKQSHIHSIIKSSNVQFGVIFQSRNPLSLKWQADFDAGITHTQTNYHQHYVQYLDRSYYSQAYVGAEIGFYPNTRTSLTAGTQLRLYNSSNIEALEDDQYEMAFNFSLQAYYYISERLRLGGNIDYYKNRFDVFNNGISWEDYNRFHYTLSLNYAIF